MISPTLIKLRLGQERVKLKRQEPTQFIKGAIFGLQIATQCILEICQESSVLRSEYQATLNRWSAAAFYKAMVTALNCIGNGDIKRARERLEKAIEGTKTSHKTATVQTIISSLPGSPRR